MTPLGRLLAGRIAACGPMTLADYMAECLLHPAHGYYTSRDPLGVAGDFTTAPEISQMFGELLGLALAQCWLDQGQPAPFTLAELGPGRGTLMADIWRVIATVPGMQAAARLHLVEASPVLRARQAEALRDARPVWHDHAATLPEAPLFLVANEFFDALPIRQFTRTASAWRETQVGLDASGALTPGLGPETPYGALLPRLNAIRPGDVVELCPALPAIAAEIAGRIARHGGAALIVDYGNWDGIGDTFQALRAHAAENPFAAPGEADLTAHVDFAALAAAGRAAGAASSRMVTQGDFLESLGISSRAARLAKGLEGAALQRHSAAHDRLINPAEMGDLFKVLAWYPPGANPPPGSEAEPAP